MAAPTVKWFDELHMNEITQFNFGVIDAGDQSQPYKFNIWNNKSGTSDASNMEECTITTRDMSGGVGDTVGKIVEVVRDKWFHAQVDSLGETDLDQPTSKIGKDASKDLGTTLSTSVNNAGAPITPITPKAKEILGINNNGNPADAGGNFVTVTLRADVPLTASAGKQDFKIRVSYRYV
ncbi:hypothetical protein [Paenibacillus agilis]|uniref:Uncharacterized protein n=1 Tax=Paenibacillus agilis TaxID=3020863 RepID=A0A559IEJ4_9BACL|nr:hypothetical protein [Paenibacillus agilis]TVX86088.1 hypothetical protein FPZ44_24440 [Paenibacillus agilis]